VPIVFCKTRQLAQEWTDGYLAAQSTGNAAVTSGRAL
jgi:hypothetical protein